MSILDRLITAGRDYLDSREDAKALTTLDIKAAVPQHPGSGDLYTTGYATFGDWDNAINQLLSGWQRTNVNYAAEVGDLRLSVLIMAAIRWAGINLAMGRLKTVELDADRKETELPDHPFQILWDQVNPELEEDGFWKQFGASWIIAGEYYALIGRDGADRIKELWFEPHTTIRPRWDSDLTGREAGSSTANPFPDDETANDCIGWYEIHRGGMWQPWPKRDVFRVYDLFDPITRRGVNGVQALLRTIFTDQEREQYTAMLLRNSGVSPIAIAPKQSGLTMDGEKMAGWLQRRTSGDQRGKPTVFTEPMEVLKFASDYSADAMEKIAHVSESRVAAALGISAQSLKFMVSQQSCLPADVQVSTVNRGPVNINEITTNDTVWSVVGGVIQSCAVTKAWKTGTRQVYKLKTCNRTIRATENHPFLVCRHVTAKGKPTKHHSKTTRYFLEWCPLVDLKPGDRIVRSVSLPDSLDVSKDISEDMMQWLGAFLGDGYYVAGDSDKGLGLCIPKQDRIRAEYETLTRKLFSNIQESSSYLTTDSKSFEIAKMYRECGNGTVVARHFGMAPSSMYKRLKLTRTLPILTIKPIHLTEGHNGFNFSSRRASEYVRSLGFIRGARNKHIPTWVFGMSESKRLAFLRGLLDTDGTVNKRGHACFRFASKRLIEDVRFLALGLGMSVSNVYEWVMPANRLPNPGKQSEYLYWSFSIMSPEDVRRIESKDPQYSSYLNKATEKKRRSSQRRGASLLPDRCEFSTIQSIIPDGVAEVYDITVENAHNFIANGLIVHNSTFNNVREFRREDYEQWIQPVRESFRKAAQRQILRDMDESRNIVLVNDYTEVPIVQRDRMLVAKETEILVKSRVIDRAEARERHDYEHEDPKHRDVYYPVPATTTTAEAVNPETQMQQETTELEQVM